MNINNNTTFVQADPSTFRAVVQKLTGVTENPLFEKLPVTTHSNLPSPRSSSAAARSNGSRNSSFKLHERRQYHNNTMRKLEIGTGFVHHQGFSTSNALVNYHKNQFRSSSPCCFNGGDQKKNMVLMSPVSTLDHHFFPSPRTPRSPQEEEEKAISEKGFYLHPSPRSKTSSNPQLLPLFPLTSPRDSSSSS
ncbi:hypothetical protein MKW94_028774 [Papaver nudicaule]|uniref:VQ domain-containing protein n=1 Tax=Papaver nudicaule TaxID=74823 RepID=A0AA41VHZ2_PAPNU|nr:hypothetical protein [Papaver nudicaule]